MPDLPVTWYHFSNVRNQYSLGQAYRLDESVWDFFNPDNQLGELIFPY